MGTDILTDEDIPGQEYGWVSVSDVEWTNPAQGRVIGCAGSEKYDLGDTIWFDPQSLMEVPEGG